jgi:tetraacyldisaccharide 4'-kinase
MDSTRLAAIMSGRDASASARFYRAALAAGTPFYGLAVKLRGAAFAAGLRKVRGLPRPVISVGNLTAGGTGKTPMVIALCRLLRQQGRTPAVLLRGYRGHKAEASGYRLQASGQSSGPEPGTWNLEPGTSPPIPDTPNPELGTRNSELCPPPPPRYQSDEEQLYREALGPQTPVAADPDRRRSAAYLAHHHPEIDVFVLDDGFQHRRVARDLDLVLIDATNPLGFGHLLPRGLLREPPGALRRADAVIVTRADQLADPVQGRALDRLIEELHGKPPIAHAAHRWVGLLDVGGRPVPLEILRAPASSEFKVPGSKLGTGEGRSWGQSGGQSGGGAKVLGICGIGNPVAFGQMLRHYSGGAGDGSEVLALDDHHAYPADELRRMLDAAKAGGFSAVLTTEKDFVKWRGLLPTPLPLPVYRAVLEIEFLDGGLAVAELLARVGCPTPSPVPTQSGQLGTPGLGPG